MDIFSNTSNTQIENENAIFTSEKIDKSDELVEAVEDLTIDNAKYYESNTATASESQGYTTHNPETVTHTSNRNKTVNQTSNRNHEPELLIKQTIPVIVLLMNPRTDKSNVSIVVVSHMVLTHTTKEVVTDTASGGAWVSRTPRKFRMTGVGRSTPCDILNAVRVNHDPYAVLIVIVSTSPQCGLNGSLQVSNKRQSTSPRLGGNTQKLDTVVDGKFPNDLYYASIFCKVIRHKIYNGSSDDLYSRCRMKFVSDVVQTQTTKIHGSGTPDHKHIGQKQFPRYYHYQDSKADGWIPLELAISCFC